MLNFYAAMCQTKDTIYMVDDHDGAYEYKRVTGNVVSISNYLHGYKSGDYEFIAEIPNDYKKVSFYIDDDIIPSIILYNVKRGYERIFLPTEFKIIWAEMDNDIFEKKYIR